MDLKALLSEPYALAMAPGFFRVYAHVGILHALEEHNLLNPIAVSGSSAGAMAAGFYASGLQPSEMIESILEIDRPKMWDPAFGLGYLRGEKLRKLIDDQLPEKSFEACSSKNGVKLGMTALDVYGGLSLSVFHKGDIATNMCASACFPVLFQPRVINGRPYIDAGLTDSCGILSLPELSKNKLVVNILVDIDSVESYSQCMPPHLQEQGARLLTICVNGLPATHPFNMTEAGRQSYYRAWKALDRYLKGLQPSHVMKLVGEHWVLYLDCSSSDLDIGQEQEKNRSKRVHILNSSVNETSSPPKRRSRSRRR
jgi:predicted acylesterase/phospholipase RssA